MTTASPHRSTAKFFGIPVGDFGAFSTLLFAAASGFLTFFVATFLGIFGIMIYNAVGHSINLNVSYRWIGAPAGVLALLFSLVYLGTLWLRHKIT